MTERKAKVLWWLLNTVIVGGIFTALSFVKVYAGKSRHGWEVWPVNSHHVVLPILMVIGYIAIPIGIVILWFTLGTKAGYIAE